MLSRALSLATVMLLIGCFAAIPVQAQNLEAGKSPSQIFAGTCAACHKSPRGLLKTVPAGSLPGFLRQHYTTSGEMASLLSAFLVSNGAADTRFVGTQPRQGKDAKSQERPAGPPDQLDRFGRRLRLAPPQEAARPGAEPLQAAKPDGDGLSPQAEPGRQGRNARRLARPGEAPEAAKPAVDGEVPAQAGSERGPDGRKLTAKQRLSKRGKPGGEEPRKPRLPNLTPQRPTLPRVRTANPRAPNPRTPSRPARASPRPPGSTRRRRPAAARPRRCGPIRFPPSPPRRRILRRCPQRFPAAHRNRRLRHRRPLRHLHPRRLRPQRRHCRQLPPRDRPHRRFPNRLLKQPGYFSEAASSFGSTSSRRASGSKNSPAAASASAAAS